MSKEVSLAAKGLAIILLLLGHATLYKMLPPSGALYFGALAVATFLVFSAVGLSVKYTDGINDNFLKKRAIKIFIPYLIFAPFTILYAYSRKGDLPLKSVVLYMLGIDFTRMIDPTMWFVILILFIYLFFFLIYSIKINIIYKIILFWIVGLIIYNNQKLFGYAPTGSMKSIIWQFRLYAFAFPLGLTLYYFFVTNKKAKNTARLIILLLAITIFIQSFQNIKAFNYYTATILSFATIVFLIAQFSSSYAKNNLGLLKYLGSISYEIYLVEWVVYRIFTTVKAPYSLRFTAFLIFSIVLGRVLQDVSKKANTLFNYGALNK